MHDDTARYNDTLPPGDRAICHLLPGLRARG